jgi:anti-sigma regulatory factor (Ser/Thr protein kinase)
MQASAQDCEGVRLQLPSEAASAKEARDAVGEIAGRIGVPVADVKLAVSEAVSNAVTHAFRGGPAGTVTVTARPEPGRLLVVVADNGSGMRPYLDSPGLGLGISLITKLATDVRFDSSPQGLTVSMCFEARSADER